MRSSVLTGLAIVTVSLLGSSAAFAGPFVSPYFGGGGQVNTTETSYESKVTAVGQTLQGVFFVSNAQNDGGQVYGYGANPQYLTGVFTGFVLQSFLPLVEPDGHAGLLLSFTGGALKYYTSPSNLFAGANLTTETKLAPTVANETAAINNIEAGTPILTLAPQVINAALDTLQINIEGGLSSFTGASTSSVWLDITGGSEAGLFNTDTFTNSYTGELADGEYTGSANSTHCASSPEWGVCGSNFATFDVTDVPEPLTLSLFGAGLAGAAAIRRRQKAKKA